MLTALLGVISYRCKWDDILCSIRKWLLLNETLEYQFHHAMISVADFVNQHHFGIRFRQMIDQYGSVEAAKRLLARSEIQADLTRLWELNAMDKSMEALVIQERFQPLFNEKEIAEARRRLVELGYFCTK